MVMNQVKQVEKLIVFPLNSASTTLDVIKREKRYTFHSKALFNRDIQYCNSNQTANPCSIGIFYMKFKSDIRFAV